MGIMDSSFHQEDTNFSTWHSSQEAGLKFGIKENKELQQGGTTREPLYGVLMGIRDFGVRSLDTEVNVTVHKEVKKMVKWMFS